MIDIEEAVYFLMASARYENDGTDTKLSWTKEGNTVANGRFKNDTGTVTVKIEGQEQVFKGNDAKRLRNLGVLQAAN